MDDGEEFFKKHHREIIELADEVKEHSDYLTYDVNPIGRTYESWRMMAKESQASIAEIENRLEKLKMLLSQCQSL